jgi:hypothetical protein
VEIGGAVTVIDASIGAMLNRMCVSVQGAVSSHLIFMLVFSSFFLLPLLFSYSNNIYHYNEAMDFFIDTMFLRNCFLVCHIPYDKACRIKCLQ